MYEVIVIGAGIEGAASAYQLAKNGHQTLLIEQFPLPHSRGSSHGQTRIIRKAYANDTYTSLMEDAYKMWFDLEKEHKVTLYKKADMVYTGKKRTGYIQSAINSLKKCNVSHTVVDHLGLQKIYPQLNFNDPERDFVIDHDAGVLRADKCLGSLLKSFVSRGGVIRDGELVTEITPGDIVTVKTTKGEYRANSIVICAGPWTNKVLKPLGLNLPLKPIRIDVCYWKILSEEFKNMLATISDAKAVNVNGKSSLVYTLLPNDEYPNHIKICLHVGPEIDPDFRDINHEESLPYIQAMCNYVKKHYPGIEPKPSIFETCMYTVTPDDHYILDSHPKWKNVVIGAGFSGHGFKIAPVVGKILMELATRGRSSYNIDLFKMSRFLPASRL